MVQGRSYLPREALSLMGEAEPTGGKHKAEGGIQPSTLFYPPGTLFLPGSNTELLLNR